MEGIKKSAKTLRTTKSSEWRVNNMGFVSLAFGCFLLLGCVSAYLLAIARGNVDAVWPFISDAAGSPPQNGLFGGLMCVGGMFGVALMLVRYLIVCEIGGGCLVSALNRLSLCAGIGAMLALTLVTGYPINWHRNTDRWFLEVGLPHVIGGGALLSLGLVHVGLQSVLTLLLKSKNKMTLLVRLLLLCACSATFVHHMVTFPHHFKGTSDKYYSNSTEGIHFNDTSDLLPFPRTLGASLKVPLDTGHNYVPSSMTQWLFLLSFCCFFFTYFSEIQQYSLLLVVETHSTKEPDSIQDRKAEIRRLSLAIEKTTMVNPKPAPEVRKFLRRDSTCQTSMDAPENGSKMISTKNGNGKMKDSHENGASKIS